MATGKACGQSKQCKILISQFAGTRPQPKSPSLLKSESLDNTPEFGLMMEESQGKLYESMLEGTTESRCVCVHTVTCSEYGRGLQYTGVCRGVGPHIPSTLRCRVEGRKCCFECLCVCPVLFLGQHARFPVQSVRCAQQGDQRLPKPRQTSQSWISDNGIITSARAYLPNCMLNGTLSFSKCTILRPSGSSTLK